MSKGARRTRIPARQPTGLYVHSSPPIALPVHPSTVRQWLRGGEIERLKEIVLEGQGSTLLGEYSPDYKARLFINSLPKILKRIEKLHDAALKGSINQIDDILKKYPQYNLELSRDTGGLGLLHKAVIYNHVPLQEWLLKNYPSTINVLDKEKRNPLHYAAGVVDTWNRLTEGGADTQAIDKEGNTPGFYMHHPRRLRPPVPESREKKRDQGLIIKPSTIRIWIHDQDIGRLQKVLWEGHGDKLKTETSNQPIVKRFLSAVPYIMGTIREVHTAAINNDLESLVNRSREPVPKDILLSKDVNGLNPLHKAAGLGNLEIVREILKRAPEAANTKDNIGRTPLHYAAGLKNDEVYQLLADSGATDHLEDKRGNTPSHYRAKPSELESQKFLNVIPDAPRTSHLYPPSWDWRILGEQPMPRDISDIIPARIEMVNKSSEKLSDQNVTEMVTVEAETIEANISQDLEKEVDLYKDAEMIPKSLISEDEGMGTEFPISTDDNVSSLSEVPNEDEQLSNTQFGETFTLNGNASEILNTENDSGNEEEHAQGDKNAASPAENANNDENAKTGNECDGVEVIIKNPYGSDRNTSDERQDSDSGLISEVVNEDISKKSSRPTTTEKDQTLDEKNEAGSPVVENESNEDINPDSLEINQDEIKPESLEAAETEEVEPLDSLEIKGTTNSDEETEVEKEEEPNETSPVNSSVSAGTPAITTSAGGSRAEILAITPSPPEDEEDAVETTSYDIAENLKGIAEDLVKSGNMEAMAEMVLSGQGSSLLGLKSENPEVQLFIDNVPQYMEKIDLVHKAAREGDLRGVQTALDRRKFAVARDNTTPLRPTPLHVAVLFGRTSVLRYLAGRFPETMHAQDSAGRTPLHYAATLPDNGHFYSLLVTLGGDKGTLDAAGNTAEHYLRNRNELLRETLLEEYQNRTTPIDTFGLNFNRYSDKVLNDNVSSRQDIDEQDILRQIESCYRIIQTGNGTILKKILTPDIFNELKFRSTRLDNTLLDLLRPGVKDLVGKKRMLKDKYYTGISIPDYESFRVFEDIINPIIREVHNIKSFEHQHPPPDLYGSETSEYFEKLNLDPSGYIIKNCVIEISRNLSPVSFARNLKLADLEKVEVALSTVLTGYYRRNRDSGFIDEYGDNYGSYYTLNEIVENQEIFKDLEEESLLAEGIDDPDSENWPYGRGVFISPFGDVTAWINIREHLKLFCTTSTDRRGFLGEAYKTMADIITFVDSKCVSVRDSMLGFLVTDPKNVGNTLTLNILVSLPHFAENKIALRKMCSDEALILMSTKHPNQFRLKNKNKIGINEIITFKNFITSVSTIIEAERAAAKVSIARIPNLIAHLIKK